MLRPLNAAIVNPQHLGAAVRIVRTRRTSISPMQPTALGAAMQRMGVTAPTRPTKHINTALTANTAHGAAKTPQDATALTRQTGYTSGR